MEFDSLDLIYPIPIMAKPATIQPGISKKRLPKDCALRISVDIDFSKSLNHC